MTSRRWYIFIAAVSVIMLALAINSLLVKHRKFNDKISLRKEEKIPYGFYVARQLLPSLFANAHIQNSSVAANNIEGIDAVSGTAIILVGRYFSPGEDEWAALQAFVKRGNHLFIITNNFSYSVSRFFKIDEEANTINNKTPDTLSVELQPPLFQRQTFSYPGRLYSSPLSLQKGFTLPLGKLTEGGTNFLAGRFGKGAIYLHTSPLAFSNYFLLHRQNSRYMSQAFSVLPASTKKIIWNDYYLDEHLSFDREPSWLKVLWQYPAFRWGLLILLFTAISFVLFNSRRKQRPIPLQPAVRNDSLDYVTTIGRLYFRKGDHHNLALKMKQHFFDLVRSRYGVVNKELTESAAQHLATKSGYDGDELRNIFSQFRSATTEQYISERQLHQLYAQLQKFYKHDS